MMKKILFFSLIYVELFSNCQFTSNKIYYVEDTIDNKILKNCKNISLGEVYVSRYYISNHENFGIEDIEIKTKKNVVRFNNIEIKFKGRVVEKTKYKIKIKDKDNKLKVFNIK